MTAASTDIEQGTAATGTLLSRTLALVVCAVMFMIFYYGSGWLSHAMAPYVEGIAKPADAPDTWWKVAKQFTHSGPAELIAVFVPVWLYCLLRGRSFADLGFNRAGTLLPWVVVIAVEALLVAVELRGPIGQVGDRFNPYALYAASMIGFSAAFSEEVFFRGFLMEELRRGGFGVVPQVIISMLFFGVAHLSYIPSDIYGWTIPVFTGICGGFWSVIYVWSKRSLWPTITAHFINDFIVVAAAYYVFGGHV
jgi:membrane protease YdiL (CAAX protease family)